MGEVSSKQQAAIVSQAQWGVDHAAEIDYPPGDIRPGPMPLEQYKRHDLTPRLVVDCSEWATCVYYAAGMPDPCGRGYDGLGNTDSMLGHLPAIPRSSAITGDLVVFGRLGDSVHVVILGQPGTVADPAVYSMGTNVCPCRELLSGEIAGHPGHPPVYLRGVLPGPAPKRFVIYRDGRVIAHSNHWRVWVATHRPFRLVGGASDLRIHDRRHDP